MDHAQGMTLRTHLLLILADSLGLPPPRVIHRGFYLRNLKKQKTWITQCDPSGGSPRMIHHDSLLGWTIILGNHLRSPGW